MKSDEMFRAYLDHMAADMQRWLLSLAQKYGGDLPPEARKVYDAIQQCVPPLDRLRELYRPLVPEKPPAKGRGRPPGKRRA